LSERKHELRAFVRAFGRAQKYYREHRNEAVAILARRCGATEEMLVRSLDGVRLLVDDDPEALRILDPEVSQSLVERVGAGMISIGMLQRIPTQAPFAFRFREPSR
jgi:ABC-type nitrate/sulfonate/bicarbonate transport system substrate-binding protein